MLLQCGQREVFIGAASLCANDASARPVAPVRVLIADDDEDNVLMLEEALGASGFEVCTARSMAEAQALLARERVDALVTDYSLGDGTGPELLESLGASRPKVAFVLTGFTGAEIERTSLAAGFQHHLVKPVSIEELSKLLLDALTSSAEP
jgi:CheY-like chemotaxis protein